MANQTEQNPKQKKYGALARKKGTTDPWASLVVFADNLHQAEAIFIQKNYEIHGNVYPRA